VYLISRFRLHCPVGCPVWAVSPPR